MENSQFRVLLGSLWCMTAFLAEGDRRYFALVLAVVWLIWGLFK